MSEDTNISIIQLIKTGEISVDYEVSQVRAGKNINIAIISYLKKSAQYRDIQQYIQEAKDNLHGARSIDDKLHFDEKLRNLYKVEQDFITNTLYLANTLSRIDPRTEKLKKAIELFEEGHIKEADALLDEADLLNDQFAFIAFVKYHKNKLSNMEDDIGFQHDEDSEMDKK